MSLCSKDAISDLNPHRRDDGATKGTILKRRAKALISFVGIAITSVSGSISGALGHQMSSFISTLVSLASLNLNATCDDLQQVTYTAINNVLAVMPAKRFVLCVSLTLNSKEQNVSGCLYPWTRS